MANILIGYSRCPLTYAAFAAHGHDVWTCDLLPAEDAAQAHMQCDIWEVLQGPWDMAVLHPMCTYLTTSAAWAFNDPDFERFPGVGYHQRVKPGTLTGTARRAAREHALDNFRKLQALPFPCAIENPAGSFLNTAIRAPDQIVQPYEYGDDASKATGLWLTNGLPPLKADPSKYVQPRMIDGRPRWGNQTDSGQNRLSPSADRWLVRSATYPGIAAAMGAQWGALFD